MSSIFVVLYETPRAPIGAAALYWQNSSVDAGPLGAQPETNVHFVARHVPASHTVLALYRSNIAADLSSQAPFATNVHFVARHQAAIYNDPLWLRSNIAADFSTPSPQPQTNTHFVARYQASQYALPQWLWQNASADAPVSVVPETNTHFVAVHQPAQFRQGFRFNTAAFDFSSPLAQPETNTYFTARHQPAAHTLPAGHAAYIASRMLLLRRSAIQILVPDASATKARGYEKVALVPTPSALPDAEPAIVLTCMVANASLRITALPGSVM